jgi:hypothetical protein
MITVLLTFENGEVKEADLADLIGQHVLLDALNTPRIDPEWGCLQFNDGSVDIEPKTLHRFCNCEHYEEVA